MTTLWKPKTFEDQLLHAYWLKVGGQIYLEVPIGGPGGPGDGPPGSKRRRIDGVRLDGPNPQAGSVRFNNYAAQFSTVIKDRPVELIEAKKKLNRLVIGQALAGRTCSPGSTRPAKSNPSSYAPRATRP